eukprot:180142_1
MCRFVLFVSIIITLNVIRSQNTINSTFYSTTPSTSNFLYINTTYVATSIQVDTDGILSNETVLLIGLLLIGVLSTISLITCLMCYWKRKRKMTDDENDGIAMQPYVPTGWSHDDYVKHNKRKKNKAPTNVSDDGKENIVQMVYINPFDDGDFQIEGNSLSDEEKANPFLCDDIIRTGQTIGDDIIAPSALDVMHLFDEDYEEFPINMSP